MDGYEEVLDSKFRVAILAAKRAKQLVNGSKKKIDMKAENPLTVAIAEINAGLVTFHELEEMEHENESVNADELLAELENAASEGEETTEESTTSIEDELSEL